MAEAAQHHAALQGTCFVPIHISFIIHAGQIISIGDCSKAETLAYFNERLHPTVPDELKDKLDFETLYDAFGGKLVHWADYIADYSERILFLMCVRSLSPNSQRQRKSIQYVCSINRK